MGTCCSSSTAKPVQSKTPQAGAADAPEKDAPATTEEKRQAREENDHFQATIKLLQRVPLLQKLPPSERPQLAAIVTFQEFKPGDVIIKEGDIGSDFYIIKSGVAEVSVSELGETSLVATLKSGDYFGERALLTDEPRVATVTATAEVVAMKISRGDFHDMKLDEKLVFPRRAAVAPGGKGESSNRPPTEKDPEVAALIQEALQRNQNLNTMVNLTPERIVDLIKAAWKENVAKGTAVITEGDLNADFFYIVSTGRFDITVSADVLGWASPGPSVRSTSSVTLSPHVGDSFGELALLYLVPRAATVTAVEDSEVFVIHRSDFKSILMKVPHQKVQEYVGYLDKVELLKPLLVEERKALAQALVEMHFDKDEHILNQGEAGAAFYILCDGGVDVTVDGEIKTSLKATPTEVKFFGERALLNNDVRAATVTVTTEKAKTLVVEREDFNLLLGPLTEILNRHSTKGPLSSVAAPTHQMGGKIRKSQLEKVGLIGCGGFGAVVLVANKASGETYALKGISKGYILKTKTQESIVNEKNILTMLNSPFIIKLFETYNGEETLYFLLEPALGGELFSIYIKKGFHGSLKHAKFYAAGTICAFEHLHERRVIYRDLKPENILLSQDGQYKLTDMGLAKFVIGKTYTTCGTPDYFAPEVIRSAGHTTAVDWWGLGVLIFEMLTGHPPFESTTPMQIYVKVMKGIHVVHFPPRAQGEAESIIKSLLRSEPSERIPMRPDGKRLVKNHGWFKGFSWTDYQELKMKPPYAPVVKHPKDISNFMARTEDLPPVLEYLDPKTGWDADFASVF